MASSFSYSALLICTDFDLLFEEVRFKNNGLDSIEVQDNGSGIAPSNYESVGKSDTIVYILVKE